MSTIQMTNLSFAYPGQPDLFTKQNLTFDNSWKLGLTGRNGRGKTTLLNLIRGVLSGSGHISMPLEPLYFPNPLKTRLRMLGSSRRKPPLLNCGKSSAN